MRLHDCPVQAEGFISTFLWLRGTETILGQGLPLVADHGRGWPAASHLAERLPYQNAIPHGFVMIAAAIHFLAVLTLVRS